MEIVIYLIVAYMLGMFVSSACVKIIDPYGFYMDDGVCTVFWPIAFPIWILFCIAAYVNKLITKLIS
jgi:hypothetical protein